MPPPPSASQPPPDPASPRLSDRRIQVICGARVLLFATFMTVAAAIPLLVRDWGLGAAAAGAIVTSFTVGYAASLFGFAWAADHLGAKRMTVISAVAAAAASALFGLFARDWGSAMVLYGLVGLAQGGVYTPLVMVFSDEVEPARRGHAMGWMIGSTSVGYAGSLGVAALGIALGGWQLAFVLSGLLPALGAAVLLAALRPLPNRVHARTGQTAAGAEIARDPRARRLIAGYTGHSWELLGMWAWMPAFLAAAFGIGGSALVGAAVAGAWVAGALHLFGAGSAFSAGRLSDRLGRRRVLVALAAGGLLGSLTLGWLLHAPAVLLVPLAFLYAGLCIADSPVLTTALSEAIRPGYLGAALAWRSLAGFGAGALAPLAFGAVFDAVRAGGGTPLSAWGAGFATLGLGGAVALACALALPRRP